LAGAVARAEPVGALEPGGGATEDGPEPFRVAVAVAGNAAPGGDGARLTALPDAVAGKESSGGMTDWCCGGGTPAEGSGVPAGRDPVGFCVGIGDGVDERRSVGGGADPDVPGAGFAVLDGSPVVGCGGAGSRPGGLPEFRTGGRPPGSVGEPGGVGVGGASAEERLPATVVAPVPGTVIVKLTVRPSLGSGGGLCSVADDDASEGRQAGWPVGVAASLGSPGGIPGTEGTVGTGFGDAEPAVGSPHRVPSS
jgi:hypothetical protein